MTTLSLRAPAIMTPRPHSYSDTAPARVGFTPQTWIALAGICVTLLVAMMTFSNRLENRITKLETKVEAIERR